jgi:hypothetical protein
MTPTYQNKTLSDSTDGILTLQGVPWYTRKIISLASVTLDVKHYTGDDTFEHIDIDQTLTGGMKGIPNLGQKMSALMMLRDRNE